jgi:DTW domain-containing protein YfiP
MSRISMANQSKQTDQQALSTSKRQVCTQCARPLSHCVCRLITVLDSKTRVVILQHPNESRHALNTARLAMLGLSHAQLHVGREFDASLWNVKGYQPHLLFPGTDAKVLMPGEHNAVSSEPYLLVVLDGTWRQARQCLIQHPELEALPRVTLPDSVTTQYRVRYAGDARALSTIEAITASLNVLEAPRSFDALLAPFEAMIAAQIEAMGEQVYHQHHINPGSYE